MTVLVNGTDKPADAKASGKIDETCPTCHEDKAAVPDCLEFGARHQDGSRRQGVLNENLIFPGLTDKKKASIAQHCDARQRCLRQARPAGLITARLEPEFFGTAQHLRHADVDAEAVTDLLRISANAVKAQQQHQSAKPGLPGFGLSVATNTHYPLPMPTDFCICRKSLTKATSRDAPRWTITRWLAETDSLIELSLRAPKRRAHTFPS